MKNKLGFDIAKLEVVFDTKKYSQETKEWLYAVIFLITMYSMLKETISVGLTDD